MPIQITGLKEIRKEFDNFDFTGQKVQSRFLELIGRSTAALASANTPRDQGVLANQWRIVSKTRTSVDVGVDDIELVEILTKGSPPHLIEPRESKVIRFEKGGQEVFAARIHHPGFAAIPFINEINRLVSNIIIDTLTVSLKESHPYFVKLKGGKGRKFQQVGRTSAGFGGGITFAGRSTLVRAGTGRRQLKRRLTLRRRRGGSVVKKTNTLKLG